MDDDLRLRFTLNGREYVLTPEQARRVARRMAERDADDSAAWANTGMLLLDFAELDEES